MIDPVPHAQRRQPAALSETERTLIVELLTTSEDPVEQVYYQAMDDAACGYVSLSTFHRIARTIDRPTRRRIRRRRSADRRRRPAPDLRASRPGEVLCWDITYLPGRYQGQTFAFYAVIDLFSRRIVGHTVQHREDSVIATAWMAAVFDSLAGRTRVLHSDNGAAMTSKPMTALLDERGVEQSRSRPAVSNDNPQIESWFHTVKGHRRYPQFFDDIDHAVTWGAEFVDFYNTVHRHSGLNGYTPDEVFTGAWPAVHAHRQAKADTAFALTPHRYRRPPRVPAPPDHARLATTAQQAPVRATTTLEKLLVA